MPAPLPDHPLPRRPCFRARQLDRHVETRSRRPRSAACERAAQSTANARPVVVIAPRSQGHVGSRRPRERLRLHAHRRRRKCSPATAVQSSVCRVFAAMVLTNAPATPGQHDRATSAEVTADGVLVGRLVSRRESRCRIGAPRPDGRPAAPARRRGPSGSTAREACHGRSAPVGACQRQPQHVAGLPELPRASASISTSGFVRSQTGHAAVRAVAIPPAPGQVQEAA